MNIWLVMSGEPLEQFGERPHRIGLLSKILTNHGHSVTWWSTTYDHQYKKNLYDNDTETINEYGVKMVFLHSDKEYKKNISYRRILNHQEVAFKFAKILQKKEKPDIIFCAFPTIDLAYEAVKYGQEYNVPVVVDVRDLWPDIFFNPFPKILHPFIKIFLQRYIKQTKFIFKNCDAITAVSDKYLNYGLNYGRRVKTEFDRVFPLAYNPLSISEKQYLVCENKFKALGVDKNKKIIWFVGTFGKTYDLSTPIKVAKELRDRNDIQFVFTGDGENAKEWKNLANGVKNIVFTGWVNQTDLAYLSEISDIGLMAYRKGAPQGLPNKIFEYLASSLPILSSLKGETEILLSSEKVGFTYEADNVESLQQELGKLIDCDETYRTMSKRCKKLFDKQYSADEVYSNLINYFELIIQKKGKK